MLILTLIAGVFLFLSAALFFGPQLYIFGPQILPELARKPEVRFVGAALVTATAFLLLSPALGSALISGGNTVQLMAEAVLGLTFA